MYAAFTVGASIAEPAPVSGLTDAKGYHASDNVDSPEYFAVSLYTKLGIDPAQVLHNTAGRPVQLVNGGRRIKDLFA